MQLSGFQATTRIIDFVKLSELEDPEEDNQIFSPKKYNRHYRKISFKLKLNRDISEMTLDYIDKLWKILMKEFRLPPLTAIIDKIIEGSLTVTWLVLPHVIEKIKATFSKSVDFFEQQNIISIELYDGPSYLTLYDESWMVSMIPFLHCYIIINDMWYPLATPHLPVQEHSSPLYRASFAGDTEQVMALVEKGTIVNQQNNVSHL